METERSQTKNGEAGKDKESNAALLRKLATGDETALDRLVQQNLPLVHGIARRFCGRGTEYEDLVQIGVIGMIKACRSFDLSLGTAFSTYAVPLIVGEIRRFLRDDGLIKVSRGIRHSGAELMREREKFISETGREPRISELARRCGLTAADAAEAIAASAEVYSLSAPVSDSEDGGTLENVIADPEDAIGAATDSLAIKEALGKLSATQRRIVFLRYFSSLTQQQTGEKLGLSQVKVSREEKKILEKLREEMTG